jgi:hypothetical protein
MVDVFAAAFAGAAFAGATFAAAAFLGVCAETAVVAIAANTQQANFLTIKGFR